MDFDVKAFKKLQKQTHTQQAIWFLNGFWDTMEPEAEKIWEMTHQFWEIQYGKPKYYGALSKRQREEQKKNGP